MPEFLEIFGAERAVDDAMVAARRDRHAIADDDFDRNRRLPGSFNLAHSENETLRRINDGGAAVLAMKA